MWPNVVENVEIYCAVLKGICGLLSGALEDYGAGFND